LTPPVLLKSLRDYEGGSRPGQVLSLSETQSVPLESFSMLFLGFDFRTEIKVSNLVSSSTILVSSSFVLFVELVDVVTETGAGVDFLITIFVKMF